MCHELELFSVFLTLDPAVDYQKFNQIKRLCHRNHNSKSAGEGLDEKLEFCYICIFEADILLKYVYRLHYSHRPTVEGCGILPRCA